MSKWFVLPASVFLSVFFAFEASALSDQKARDHDGAPSERKNAANGPLTSTKDCVAGQWHKFVGGKITVSADNSCGKVVTCDVHLVMPIAGGSKDLKLNCLNAVVPVGHTDAICQWTGQPATVGGTGSMTCK